MSILFSGWAKGYFLFLRKSARSELFRTEVVRRKEQVNGIREWVSAPLSLHTGNPKSSLLSFLSPSPLRHVTCIHSNYKTQAVEKHKYTWWKM